MWTEQSRGRMAKIAKKTKRYPSDLTDEEWDRIAPLMPKPGRRGRPREVEFREVINAVRYLVRSGGGWRMLPVHFGPWQRCTAGSGNWPGASCSRPSTTWR
jgi:transposase